MQGNAMGESSINLKGVLSGNPSTNRETDGNTYVPFLANHALVSIMDFQQAIQTCHGNYSNPTPACQAVLTDIFGTEKKKKKKKKTFLSFLCVLQTDALRADKMGTRINPYNIYDKCVGKGPQEPGYCYTFQTLFRATRLRSQTFVPCMNYTAVVSYMNRKDVQSGSYPTEKKKNSLGMFLTRLEISFFVLFSHFCGAWTCSLGYLLTNPQLRGRHGWRYDSFV
jgi:hypothetical protein